MNDLVFQAPQTEKARLVFFHGYGANGENLTQCAEYFQKKNPNITIIVPDGHEPFEGHLEGKGRQWFSLSAFHSKDLIDTQGYSSTLQYAIERSARNVSKRFQFLIEDPLPLILAGFSQGAALACHLGLFHMPCALVLGFSGFYRIRTVPVYFPDFWLYHGKKDDVVPLEAMHLTYKDLFNNRLSVEQWIDPNAAHNISIDALDHALAFLSSRNFS
ncbi:MULTISPECIES: alpha/beta hydrolase [Holospora]|uniref:Putative hydrolase n=2 Tax=Holospora TaxID=44747 RepID=A0A061JFZ3_9PROT|nr:MULTISPECIES: phospholipase/carboxylesterase [Holospora]ETZ04721.1 putative hydrolase [Holospora undulata HU1]